MLFTFFPNILTPYFFLPAVGRFGGRAGGLALPPRFGGGYSPCVVTEGCTERPTLRFLLIIWISSIIPSIMPAAIISAAQTYKIIRHTSTFIPHSLPSASITKPKNASTALPIVSITNVIYSSPFGGLCLTSFISL